MKKITKGTIDKHIPNLKFIRDSIKKMGKTYPKSISQLNLGGACAITSYVVYLYFQKQGYNPKFRATDRHCWIQLDNYFVDLTATQFGFKEEVLIKSKIAFEKMVQFTFDYYKPITLETPIELKKHICTWSSEQNPFYFINSGKGIVKSLVREYQIAA